ncbi:uncharacterized protein MYCFIDRAFT_211056 [Pseudocercospora fijiensis CIRAD86]|uniref:Uncharacterized protein n=1 Tax=Pseudocercospora fijiensis (strain CIRAD86) TaxID=383855 RepID=M3A1T8_PSEFD|nr:uncharacterized protein MYCFIDRAFT_211056 [Pseudocercospora fijiensis CIRAD86]EME85134.1 hypothetical protein MYCFIDRAFT_211056 [Pseudocercospora fijiensis CIRAD86]
MPEISQVCCWILRTGLAQETFRNSRPTLSYVASIDHFDKNDRNRPEISIATSTTCMVAISTTIRTQCCDRCVTSAGTGAASVLAYAGRAWLCCEYAKSHCPQPAIKGVVREYLRASLHAPITPRLWLHRPETLQAPTDAPPTSKPCLSSTWTNAATRASSPPCHDIGRRFEPCPTTPRDAAVCLPRPCPRRTTQSSYP